MSLLHPARGLRRIELTTHAPEPTVDFFAQLFGWSVLPEAGEVFGGWVGDRLAVRISPGDAIAWRLVFAGLPARALEHGVAVDRGRVLHGPWAPEPRPGEPCWVDLLGDTSLEAELGWRTRDPHDLFEIDLDDAARPVAGRLTADTGPVVYFSVPDVDTAVAAAVELGGSVVTEPHDAPTGLVASIAEPAGAVVTLLQAPAGWGGAWAHVPESTDSGTP